MTTIGGPSGIGGPTGPGGPRPSEPSSIADVAGDAPVERSPAPAGTGETGEIDAIVAELAAGRVTARDAIDRLVEAMAGPGLDEVERAELRELLGDLVANDPHLQKLMGQVPPA